MRKPAILLSLLLLTFSSFGQNKVPTAATILNTAYQQAKLENKNVLVIFHASWCVWCRKMDSSLQDKNIKPLIDKHYITSHLTVYESKDKTALENAGALEFLTKQGGADKGLPYWLVLDASGNLLADSQLKPNQNSGCPATAEEVSYFVQVLQKTSPLKGDQLKVIEQRFRMNEQ